MVAQLATEGNVPTTVARKDMPSTGLGKWAMWLGVTAAGLGVLVYAMSIVTMALKGSLPPGVVVTILAASLVCAIVAVPTGFVARKRGDVSFFGLIALIAASVVSAFWAFMLLGEVLFPH